MTRWTVLTIAAVTDVIAVGLLVADLRWGSGPGTARILALAGTVVLATVGLVILFVVSRGARPIADEPAGFFPTTRADVEFRDRGDRFGPP
jgi:hypothetical protein